MNLKLKAAIVGKFGTQGGFADALGVHESYVSQVLNGRRELSLEKQDEWADLLGVTSEESGLRECAKPTTKQ